MKTNKKGARCFGLLFYLFLALREYLYYLVVPATRLPGEKFVVRDIVHVSLLAVCHLQKTGDCHGVETFFPFDPFLCRHQRFNDAHGMYVVFPRHAAWEMIYKAQRLIPHFYCIFYVVDQVYVGGMAGVDKR